MSWGGNVGSGDLAMSSGDTITTGVVSAQVGAFLNWQMSGVASAATFNAQSGGANYLDARSAFVAANPASMATLDVRSLSFSTPNLATSATAGSGSSLPATPETYLIVSVSGQNLKVPCYLA